MNNVATVQLVRFVDWAIVILHAIPALMDILFQLLALSLVLLVHLLSILTAYSALAQLFAHNAVLDLLAVYVIRVLWAISEQFAKHAILLTIEIA